MIEPDMSDSQHREHNREVIILGPLNLQNEFLNYVIERELGAKCQIYDNEIRQFPEGFTIPMNELGQNPKKYLFLVDSTVQSVEKIMKDIFTNRYLELCYISLFNLKIDTGIEGKALSKNIRGFFYKDDSFDIFIKGLKAIFNEEVWVSRDVLLKVVFDTIEERRSRIQQKTSLTQRQIEILSLVSMGASNDEIADKMTISENTVKTHLYNIFKKINVPNRLQAALWAAKHL